MFLTFKFYHNCHGMSSKDVIEFNLDVTGLHTSFKARTLSLYDLLPV